MVLLLALVNLVVLNINNSTKGCDMSMHGKKASPRQIAFLQSRGITPPTGMAMCSRFIGFIKENNGMGPGTESERIALLKATKKKYEGKKARLRDGQETVITRIFPKTMGEVLENKMAHGNSESFSPFLASHTVIGANGRKQGVYSHFSYIALLE